MEPFLALKTATTLLALAAAGGVLMAIIRLRGAPRPPSSLAMAHGLLAAAALTLLLYFWATTGLPSLAKGGTVALLLAALGGTWLNIRYHSKMEALPIPIVLMHGATAVIGFALLLAALRANPG